ncbi:helix-turn-helix domain-containing protein [Saccharothrix lopnurensis]|uniref:Helix-turn-helix domain-containing protein n=1 Tax=Saccharothrix lopnurensis TaxID=1670621 RepID=A0ABW1PHH2_9PSEU
MSFIDDGRDRGVLRSERPVEDRHVEPEAPGAPGDPDTAAGDGSRSSVLERAFQMLKLVANEKRPMNLTEMSRAVRLPLPTTYRLAKALVRLRALERDRGRYTLGPVWSEWSDATLERQPADSSC